VVKSLSFAVGVLIQSLSVPETKVHLERCCNPGPCTVSFKVCIWNFEHVHFRFSAFYRERHNYRTCPDLPDATETVAHGGYADRQGLKFLTKKLIAHSAI